MSHPAADHQPRRLLHADGLELNVAAVAEEYLRNLAAVQGADRVAGRFIGPEREIVAGTFGLDRVADLAREIADYNARGFHCYAHIQAVGAPLTNRLLAGRLGCVRTEGIRAYTILTIDIDPEPGAEPGVALEVAWALVEVLVSSAGVPRGAICVKQSGRGAYVLVAIEPQPLAVRETMRRATSALARIIDAAELPAHGDEGVFDAARIVRIAGTTNHKPDADPTVPAWVLQWWTPGVRCPWSVVERIAAKAKPKLRAVPTAQRIDAESASISRRPLRALFTERGWLYRERADGVCDVRCPNADQHTDGRDGAILYPPREPGGPGWLKCSHAHCTDLDLFTVFRLLEGRA